jgi:hypothetical protein
MWKDITSYSKGDIERKPRSWQLRMPGGLRLVIVWNHRDYPGEWICHLHPWFKEVRLNIEVYENLEAAKEAALIQIIKTLETIVVFAKEAGSQPETLY